MNYREVRALAEEYDKRLLATDPRFRRSVLLLHQDGSIFRVDSAFLMQKGAWILMFSEHHGYHVYHQEDLLYFAEVQPIHDPIEVLEMEIDNGTSKE